MADFSFTIGGGAPSLIPTGTGTLVTEAQENLIPDFQCDPQMLKLVASYIVPLETLETAIKTICALLTFSDYEGRALDDLGEIVGQTRNGLADPAYQQAIATRVVANAAQADSDVLIYLVKQALGFTGDVTFIDSYPAGYILQIPVPLDPGDNVAGAAAFLFEATGGGILGVFVYGFSATPFQYDAGSGYDVGSYATGVNA